MLRVTPNTLKRLGLGLVVLLPFKAALFFAILTRFRLRVRSAAPIPLPVPG